MPGGESSLQDKYTALPVEGWAEGASARGLWRSAVESAADYVPTARVETFFYGV
jgi:hypothetical protein